MFHGTPSTGAGVAGCLEMGASVLCLCHDTFHKDYFDKVMKQRVVEAMLAGSSVFRTPSYIDGR